METSGARLTSLDIIELSKLDRVFGLGEMMDYFSVISGSEHVLRSLVVARQAGLPIDGHAPGFVGRLLQAYAAAGISSDHECVSIQEVVEKLKAGMNVMIREGSAAKNLATLLPAVTDFNLRRFCLVTDDKYPEELLREGYLDSTLSKAVVHGLKPAAAIQMVTLNPAEHYGLLRRGAVAPGYLADLVVLDDLKRFKVRTVIKNGVPVVRNGEMLKDLPSVEDRRVLDTVDIRHLSIRSFAIKADGTLCRVIQLVPNQILTRQQLIHPTVERGYVKADPTRDLLKLAVVERHHASGRIGLGLVSGFNLKQGALGTTVAHDSHNIIIVGTNDRDMLEVANQLKRMGGGYVAVAGEAVVSLRLPVAGLMSLQNAEKVANDQRRLLEVSKSWGSQLPNPLTALSFLALPVIPELRLTDKGLVDVRKSRMASLFVWN